MDLPLFLFICLFLKGCIFFHPMGFFFLGLWVYMFIFSLSLCMPSSSETVTQRISPVLTSGPSLSPFVPAPTSSQSMPSRCTTAPGFSRCRRVSHSAPRRVRTVVPLDRPRMDGRRVGQWKEEKMVFLVSFLTASTLFFSKSQA